MPSSTSNSSHRIPTGPVIRMWGLTGIVFLISLGTSEFLWRRAGHLPCVEDTRLLWCMHRDRVYSSPRDRTLVVIGTSRAQLGIDPQILEKEFPDSRVIHLAINGTPPYEILKDLCLDPEFNGTILCATTAAYIMPDMIMSRLTEFQGKDYVSYFHNEFKEEIALSERVNTWVEVSLQDKLVTLSPRLNLNSLFEYNLNVPPTYLHMRSDRFRPAFYSRMTDHQRIRHHKRGAERRLAREAIGRTRISKKVFQKKITQELGYWYTRLLERGGALVLVRMPTSGEGWQANEKDMPKKEYWDTITHLSGVSTIHFKDHEELADYECPDTAHLDAHDAPEFTRRLARIIKPVLEKD